MKKIFLILLVLIGVSGCTQLDLDIPNSNALENDKDFVVNENQVIAHYIDVGQGDASFIELPNGEVMLIEAGIASSSEKIIDYIKNLGYNRIDYVVATHPHADHIGGMAEVIEAFDVGAIYMPKAVSTSKTYENLLETIKNKGLSVKTGKVGVSVLQEEDLTIEMLAPNQDKYSSLNNYSIVLKITYGNTSFLYTGDAEELSEKEIMGNVEADVLKVGHHGSDTSSSEEFLKRVNPKYAVISVGEDNSYDHPASSTIKKLEKYTDHIYRTDLNGTVVVTSDGVNIAVKTERG